VIAYFVYLNVSLDSMILELLIADLAAMLFIYVMSLILNNASLYDPYWSVIPPVFLIFVFIESGKTLTLPHFMMLFAISFWGVRLTLNWIKGWHGFSEVDWRYLMIRDKAPKLYFLTNFLAIQLFPTLIIFAQLIVGIKILTIDPNLNIVFTMGFLLVILATAIQYISDEQMRRFRKAHVGEKKCIDEGLWRISRHPNYFGEVTVWWGLYIMLFGLTYQFDLYILAPLSMTLLFVFISIPMMEKKILKTRPEYKLYQEQVSMLIPYVRKQKEASVYQKES
jgi:steroid 5-alpha reductase family enzyme